MRTFFGIVGILIGLVSLLFTIAAASDLSAGTTKGNGGVILALFVVFGGLTVFGVEVARRNLRKRKAVQIDRAERERMLLELAQAGGGRLTAAEAAMKLPFTLEETRHILEELVGLRTPDDLHLQDELARAAGE